MRLFAWLLTKLFGAPRRIGSPDDPLMLRWHLGRWFGRDYRVHHILRPDNGPDPHDHPYAFTSRVLRGWLEETVLSTWGDQGVAPQFWKIVVRNSTHPKRATT